MNTKEPDLLKQFIQKGESQEKSDEYNEDDYKAFGVSRGRFNNTPMIRFVKRNGNPLLLPYIGLDGADCDLSGSLILQFTNQIVTIEGNCLKKIVGPLQEQRILFIREADEATAMAIGDREDVIESLTITPRQTSNL